MDVGADADGQRRQRRRGGFSTKKEAERGLREVLVKVDRDTFVEPSEMTVHDFLTDEWMPVMRRTVRRSTWTRRRNYIEKRILPRIGHVRLQELSAPMLNRLYADIEQNGRVRGDAPLAPKTVRDAHKILHRALNDAMRWGYVERNVAELADPPSAKLVNAARKEAIRIWSPEQLLHFLEVMRDDPWFPLWMVAATTGLRRSELLGLRWRDVDLRRGRLAVRQVLVTSDGQPALEPITKNANARVVDIDRRVAAVLRRHHAQQQTQRQVATDVWEDHDLVFTRADGHWLNPDHVSHEFVRMHEDAGLPRIRLQDLRHTHASLLLAEGEPTKVVQERLGHHSAAFTTDTYQHVTPGMQQRAAQRFVDLVYGGDPDPAQTDLKRDEDES